MSDPKYFRECGGKKATHVWRRDECRDEFHGTLKPIKPKLTPIDLSECGDDLLVYEGNDLDCPNARYYWGDIKEPGDWMWRFDNRWIPNTTGKNPWPKGVIVRHWIEGRDLCSPPHQAHLLHWRLDHLKTIKFSRFHSLAEDYCWPGEEQ